MQSGLLGFLLATVSAVTTGNAPVSWSPNGNWIATTTLTSPTTRSIPEPGWIFDTHSRFNVDFGAKNNDLPPAESPEVVSRLHLCSTSGDRSILVEETNGRLSSPAWRADGLALAVARITRREGGGEQLDVLIHESVGKARVLYTSVCEEECSPGPIHRFGFQAVAWSPDGRYLAVPVVNPNPAIKIIRADNGQVVCEENDAYWPSWSPDSARLAYLRGQGMPTLKILDTSFGPARDLPAIGKTFQPPQWAADSRSLYEMSVRSGRPGQDGSSQIEISRINVDSGAVAILSQIRSEPLDRGVPLRNLSFAFSKTADDLYYSLDFDNQPPAIVWYCPMTSETINPMSPIDTLVKASVLGLSPVGNQVAARFGPNASGSVIGLFDISAKALTPIVTDDGARVEWLKLLVNTARSIVRINLPRKAGDGRLFDRPTIFPITGEIAWNSEAAYRLRRIAKIGLPLCRRPETAGPAVPELLVFLKEARFFFEILNEDYKAAMLSLEALEESQDNPDRRLRLLSLRAQIYVADGDYDRARDAVKYLKTDATRHRATLEETALGFVMNSEDRGKENWPDYLGDRIEETIKQKQTEKSAAENQLGNTNADQADFPTFNPFPLQNEPRPGVFRPNQPIFGQDDEPPVNRKFRGPRGAGPNR